MDYRAIGSRIRQARQKKGMTQEDVVSKVDISIPHFSNIERGVTKPSLEIVVRIINALNVAPNEIFQDVVEDKSKIYAANEISLFEGYSKDEIETMLEHIDILKESLRRKRK